MQTFSSSPALNQRKRPSLIAVAHEFRGFHAVGKLPCCARVFYFRLRGGSRSSSAGSFLLVAASPVYLADKCMPSFL